MASKTRRKTNQAEMNVELAHAAALDAVDGPATRKRKEPWNDAAWDDYFKAFHRFLGTDDPAKVAELFADNTERRYAEAARPRGAATIKDEPPPINGSSDQLALELGEHR